MNWEFARFWKKQQTKAAAPAAAAPATVTTFRAADGTIRVVQNLDELKYCQLPGPIETSVARRNRDRLMWACDVGEMRRLLPEGSAVTYAGTTFTIGSYVPAVCEYSVSYGSAGAPGSTLVTYKEPPTIEPKLITHYTDRLGVFHTRVFEYGEWWRLTAAKRAENEKGDAQ